MSNATLAWRLVNNFYQSTRRSIQVCVSHEADAACATLTLLSLLKTFLINYDVHPIGSYKELEEIVQLCVASHDGDEKENPEIADDFFILVGLGAPVALDTIFDFDHHFVVVLDSLRPFHLSNLRAASEFVEMPSPALFLWDMEVVREEVDNFFRHQLRLESRRRFRRRQRHVRHRHEKIARAAALDAGDLDDTLDNAENDNDGDDSVSSATDNSRLSSSDSESNSDTDDSSDDEYGNNYSEDDFTPSQSQERIDWMSTSENAVSPEMEALYYSCVGGGRSCAVHMYELSILLNRYNPTFLWHAAVGVCDLLLRGLVDYSSYLVAMQPLHDAVTSERSTSGRRGMPGSFLEEVETNQTRIRRHSSMQLCNFTDPQLFLLRHTSLWNAIWLHPQTASALGLHHVEDRTGFVSQLLASLCGVSRKMAEQPWREVALQDRQEALHKVTRELKAVMSKRASFFPFPNEIRCIARTAGYSAEVSTFDAHHLFEATMAAQPPPSLYVVDDEKEIGNPDDIVEARLRVFFREQFWKAYHLIDADPNEKEFNGGVVEALSLQQQVSDAAVVLMQAGVVQSIKTLHFTKPTDPTKTMSALESFNTLYRTRVLAQRMLWTLAVERPSRTGSVSPLLLSCAVPSPLRRRTLLPFNDRYDGNFMVYLASDNLGDLSGARARGSGTLLPSSAVERFRESIQDEDVYTKLPRQSWVERSCVALDGREGTTRLAELMHLKFLAARRQSTGSYRAKHITALPPRGQKRDRDSALRGGGGDSFSGNNNTETLRDDSGHPIEGY